MAPAISPLEQGAPELEFHVQRVLEMAWKGFYHDFANIKPLFRGVAEAELRTWHAPLVASHGGNGPQVFLDGEHRDPALPCFILTGQEDNELQGGPPLGNNMKLNGVKRFPTMDGQSVSIECRTANRAQMRVMRRVVRAIMRLAIPTMCKAGGYDNIRYAGGSGLKPEEALLVEAVLGAICVYTMRYETNVQYSIPEPVNTTPDITWSVALAGTLGVDGTPGGVVAYTPDSPAT